MPTENVKLSENTKTQIEQGRPKSGRIWKKQKQRFSSIKNQRAVRSTFEEKVKLRAQRASLKEYEAELAQKAADEKAAKKAARLEREENIKRKAKKAEVVQVISNARKIKKMSRKQLKAIETR